MNVLLILFFIFSSLFMAGLPSPLFAASENVNINATVPGPVCGDGIIGSGEQCDGSNLGGATCVSIGFGGGSLSCNANCAYSTSQCISIPTSSSGGGGGGGGGNVAPATGVVFSGRAYPLSKVVVLKDGQIAVSTIAGPDARFEVSLAGLSTGNYNFAVYGEDSKGTRSNLFTFPNYITSGATARVGGIFLAPTIAVDKSEVKRGENIAIFGQSTPSSEVTISINSEEEFFMKKISDAGGVYLLNFDTSILEMGQHLTKSKAALSGEISSFSKTVSFVVGAKNVFAQSVNILRGDLNNDGRVNLVDFSIAAYWYKQSINAEFLIKEKERLSGDGKVDLTDFSIMAYYWTG